MNIESTSMTPNEPAKDAELNALRIRGLRISKTGIGFGVLALCIMGLGFGLGRHYGIPQELNAVDIPLMIRQALPGGATLSDSPFESAVETAFGLIKYVVIAFGILSALLGGILVMNGEQEKGIRVGVSGVLLAAVLSFFSAVVGGVRGTPPSKSIGDYANNGDYYEVASMLKNVNTDSKSMKNYVLAQVGIVDDSSKSRLSNQTKNELAGSVRDLANGQPQAFANPAVMFQLEKAYLGQIVSTGAKQYSAEAEESAKFGARLKNIAFAIGGMLMGCMAGCLALGNIISKRTIRIIDMKIDALKASSSRG